MHLKFMTDRLAIASNKPVAWQTNCAALRILEFNFLHQHNPTSKKYLKDLKDLQV